ncbi:MAG: hypothetical protein ACKO5K_08815, partial [Armatimonadota bacterium]
ILASDRELEILSDDPDAVIDLSLTHEKEEGSLRGICARAQSAGQRTLILAHDHFFHQYRPGQFSPRRLTPDTDEAIERIARIGRVAAEYGLGLELSVLSPLELGPVAARSTGQQGLWMQYRKGVRDPRTGTFSVDLWRQRRWENNKGVVELVPDHIRVFAFRETPVPGTLYSVVDPDAIEDITFTAGVEVLVEEPNHTRIRIYGHGDIGVEGLDRVLVVQALRTPEMDYFGSAAEPYLRGLCDRYLDAGVPLNALYSDELHIQQDWIYHDHHDHGQLAIRYVSDGLRHGFAQRHGERYLDFARWLVYFCQGQEDWRHDLSAGEAVQHVWGADPESIRATQKLRADYHRFLQDGVVDLFAGAKRYLEGRLGKRLEARAHSTWAESPTIDFWRKGPRPMVRNAYEYTPDFLWSNTIHQAAAACHDYFKWTDFLTATGNDHCECGWSDRNYVGIALACSFALVSDVPSAYAAHWGMPGELARRRQAVVDASGCAGAPEFAMVQDMAHREVDVLFLYPLDMVALDERFGSWTAQYGYADFVPQDVLIDRGRVVPGGLEIRGRTYRTVVATCEPFPRPELLPLIASIARAGGTVIWSGPAPRVGRDGVAVGADWETVFGVEMHPDWVDGVPAPGRRIRFEGPFAGIAPMDVLTDFPVDKLHPVLPREGTAVAARSPMGVVGTLRSLGDGRCVVLGFRPRDDQSASLGHETRWWFELLTALGAYAGDDNPEAISRSTEWYCCGFPNGAVAIAPHFRNVEEDWQGTFGRDVAVDAAYLDRVPPPSNAIELEGFRIRGRAIDYRGRHAMTVRVDDDAVPVAFAGCACDRISVDGREWIFADRVVGEIAWAPVGADARVVGGATVRIKVSEAVVATIPIPGSDPLAVFAEGAAPGSRGAAVDSERTPGVLRIRVDAHSAGKWLFAVPV